MATDQAELLCEKLCSLSIYDPDRYLQQDEFNKLKQKDPSDLFRSLLPIITSDKDLTIRKQAVDSIRILICDAIDNDRLRCNIPWFMHELVEAGVEADDPLQEYIQKAFCQICRSKKEKFVPYIDGLIDSVLVDLEISELQPVGDDAKDMVIFSTADGKKTGLKGLKKSVLKKMIRAVDLLSTFIKILGVQLGKHVVAAGNSLVPLLSFPFDIDIKRSILAAIAELFSPACEWSASNPLAHLPLSQWVEKVVTNVLKDLALSRDDAGKIDLDLMLVETRGLNKCLRNAGPKTLKHKQLGDLCEKVFALMGESSQRSVANDSEQALRSTLREINTAVMMFHWDMYTSGEEWCRKFIETHLDPNCSPADRALALYVCGDLLKHLKGYGEFLWPTFALQLVESVGDPDPGVRRAAAFGLIQAAEQAKFSDELIQTAAAQIIVLLRETQSQEEAFLSATDNMVAALGAILQYCRFEKGTNQSLPEKFLFPWIYSLPLKVNDKEGRRVHGYFMELLDTGHHEVFGPHNSNFPQFVAICASIYRTDFSTAKIDKGIRSFIKSFGFGVTSSVGANLDKEMQKGLKRIYLDLDWA